MSQNYEMNPEQRGYLETLVCQRLKEDEANRQIIEKFENSRNEQLPEALRGGWNADKQDKVAYYLIKDPQDEEPLLFFSLKCGEIHVPYDPRQVDEALKNAKALLNAALGRSAPEWAQEVINRQLVDGILPAEALDKILERCARGVNRRTRYIKETNYDSNQILRTKKTHAGVELVHFCVHEPAREKWAVRKMDSQGMGRTLFWQFVVPVIQEIRKLVGVEYLYLFAADNKKKTLAAYYRELGFEERSDLSVAKPEYDFCCLFMCQKVTALRNRQWDFFKNYNKQE